MKTLARRKFHDADPPEQKILAKHAEGTKKLFQQYELARNYGSALVQLSNLRPHIDSFFDKVMVMVPDDNVRSNRLALLDKLSTEFSTIADFSEIVPEGKESKESSKQ